LEFLISGVAIPKAAVSQEEANSTEGAQAEGQVKDRVNIFIDKTSGEIDWSDLKSAANLLPDLKPDVKKAIEASLTELKTEFGDEAYI